MFSIKCTKCGYVFIGKFDPDYECPKCKNAQFSITKIKKREVKNEEDT